MVKLTGPMLSRAASGTLAGQLTFGFSGTTPTLRKKPTPKQPRSGLQISMRAMMTFLSKQWKNLTTNQQETWNLCGTHKQLDAYHRYLGHNLERWRNKTPPTKEYPAAEQGDSAIFPVYDAIGGVRHCVLSWYEWLDPKDTWTWLIFHKLGADPPENVQNLIHVGLYQVAPAKTFTHQNLPPGIHHYHFAMATDDGKPSWGLPMFITATVT